MRSMLAARVAVLAGCTDVTIDPLIAGLALKPHKDAATPDQAVPVEAMPAQAVPVDATATGGAAGVIYQTGERRLSAASATHSTPARRTRRLGRAEAVPNDVTACGERSFGRAHSGHRPCARNVPGLTRA